MTEPHAAERGLAHEANAAEAVPRHPAAGRRRRVISFCARLDVLASGLLLLYTGMTKALETAAFASTLGSHAVVPDWAVPALSLVVPAIEILFGASAISALALSRGLGIVAFGHAALFLTFMVYTGVIDLRPTPQPSGCGCGLRSGPIMDWTPLVIQNGLCAIVLSTAGRVLTRVPSSARR